MAQIFSQQCRNFKFTRAVLSLVVHKTKCDTDLMSESLENNFVAETPDEYKSNPRMQSAQRNSALRLQMVQGIGPRIYGDLIKHFGSPEGVLSASPSDIRGIPGVGAKLSNNIALASDIDIEPLLDCCQGHGISILQRGGEGYSKRLEEIYDPPAILFGKGNVLPCDELSIAIVGTRQASSYGIKVADQLARGLALAGLTIVSGLARGIDAAAHKGALAVGGRTIAVLGGGLLKMYPPEHQSLADEISQSGAVLSESLPQQAPKSGSFPRRNRIVTGCHRR
jgi:DNA processing protein